MEKITSTKGEAYKYGFSDPDKSLFKTKKGLSEKVIREISKQKKEPAWMLEKRLKAFKFFLKKPMPEWGADLSNINFDEIIYYVKPSERKVASWDEVPENIKNTFDKLGIPEYERKFLAGVGAQYDSENVYHHVTDRLKELGVIFTDVETAIITHPELVKKYFGTVIPVGDNKFAALNSAVWSGGSFIYVPKGVHVDLPLQAYFRINAENMGQFERTLIIADEGSQVHYIEGCSAPIYTSGSLHSAVVEVIALKGAKVRYTTVQNWSKNVYNLVTKRAIAHEDATVEWVDFNMGSGITMKYPSVYLLGKNARADILSMAYASDDQILDAGSKVIHAAPNTTSVVRSKSISKGSGKASFRGLLNVTPKAKHVKASVQCDALLLDDASKTDTYPTITTKGKGMRIDHEARVSRIDEKQLLYLKSRGLSEVEANALLINGFIEPLVKELPMEYAVEMNRLIELSMEGSIG